MISVIIPVYNTKRYLQECIRSVQSQTCRDLEILLVDDGSTDGSRELCEEFSRDDDRIRLLPESHRGVSAARNRGLDTCRGAYVFFMDSDDIIHPRLLERYVCYLSKEEADYLYCAYTGSAARWLWGEPEVPGMMPIPAKQGRELFHSGGFRGIGGKCVRAEYLEGLRFEEGLSFGEDALLNYQLLRKGGRFVSLDAPWYCYRQHPASACATGKNRIGNNLDFIKRIRDSEYGDRDALADGAFYALRWERTLAGALRSAYLRARTEGPETLCRALREQLLAETGHPLFAELPLRDRAAFRLCLENPFAYRGIRQGLLLCRQLKHLPGHTSRELLRKTLR